MIDEEHIPPPAKIVPDLAFEQAVVKRGAKLCTEAEPHETAGMDPCVRHIAEARSQLWEIRSRQEDRPEIDTNEEFEQAFAAAAIPAKIIVPE